MTILFCFFWIRGNLTLRKAHFVGPGEGVKPRLSQALTRDARLDSNSRPAVQISNPFAITLRPLRTTISTLPITNQKANLDEFFFF
jgi:hypothetical protein